MADGAAPKPTEPVPSRKTTSQSQQDLEAQFRTLFPATSTTLPVVNADRTKRASAPGVGPCPTQGCKGIPAPLPGAAFDDRLHWKCNTCDFQFSQAVWVVTDPEEQPFPATGFEDDAEQLAAVPTSSNPINPDKHRTIGKQISEFDRFAGKLMAEARNSTSTRTLPKSVMDRIFDSIDAKGFTPGKYLEGEKRQQLNNYNRDKPHVAIKTFKAAAKHRLFRRAVGVRLWHARDNNQEATGDMS